MMYKWTSDYRGKLHPDRPEVTRESPLPPVIPWAVGAGIMAAVGYMAGRAL